MQRAEVNVCNYEVCFIGYYGQMEGLASLLKSVKAVVERVIKEMQTKEHKPLGDF